MCDCGSEPCPQIQIFVVCAACGAVPTDPHLSLELFVPEAMNCAHTSQSMALMLPVAVSRAHRSSTDCAAIFISTLPMLMVGSDLCPQIQNCTACGCVTFGFGNDVCRSAAPMLFVQLAAMSYAQHTGHWHTCGSEPCPQVHICAYKSIPVLCVAVAVSRAHRSNDACATCGNGLICISAFHTSAPEVRIRSPGASLIPTINP